MPDWVPPASQHRLLAGCVYVRLVIATIEQLIVQAI